MRRRDLSEGPGSGCSAVPLSWTVLVTLLGLAGPSLFGCRAGAEQGLGDADQDLALRASIDPARYGAVGVVGAESGYPEEPIVPVCIGTLIGPKTILTPYTCGDGLLFFKMYFSYGSNPLQWKNLVPLVDGTRSTYDPQEALNALGGNGGPGRVAVMHLANEVAGMAPLDVAAISDQPLGTTFAVPSIDVGAGRRARFIVGRGDLIATAGPAFPEIFETFDLFRSWSIPHDVQPTEAELLALRSLYEGRDPGGLLDDGDEVLVKGRAGDPAFPALGSGNTAGSPLVRATAAGKLEIYGVFAANIPSTGSDPPGEYRSSDFKVFAPETLAFLKAARTWADPCATRAVGVTCDGPKIRTCGADHLTSRVNDCWIDAGVTTTCHEVAGGFACQ